MSASTSTTTSAAASHAQDASKDAWDGDPEMRHEANQAARDDLTRAIYAGKKSIWPVFMATVLVGIGTSVWGLLKYKSEDKVYFRWIFTVVLVGWTILAGIEGFMLNELMTERRTHHPSIVLRICFAFGGWFTGYCAAACVLVGMWMYQGHFDDGKTHTLGWGLLIIQALLCAACVVGFVCYIVLYGRKLKKIPMQADDVSKIRSVRRQLSDKSRTVRRRMSDRSSKRSRRTSGALTLVRQSSTRSGSSAAPKDGGYGDDGYGKDSGYGKHDDYGKTGGYDSDCATTSGSEDTLLSKHDDAPPSTPPPDYHARARQPAPSTVSRQASTASSYANAPWSSNPTYTTPTTASGLPIPPMLQAGPSPSSRAYSPPASPTYHTSSTIPVVMRSGSQVTRAAFDPHSNRYVSSSTSTVRPASTSSYGRPGSSSSSYGRPGSSSSSSYIPYRSPSTASAGYAAYSAAPTMTPRSYSPPYSPSSSPPPVNYTNRPYSPPPRPLARSYSRSSANASTPGLATRPPPSSSAPPPSTSRYQPPSSLSRSASSSSSYYAAPPRSSVTNPDPPRPSAAGGNPGAGAGGSSHAQSSNPDALPAMPEYHKGDLLP
ncbi:hypothetical protein JCM10449v2_000808 [Rhodotorula kratochvilovae]